MGHAETFEHTADLGLRAVGRDLSDLFETAASGLFDIIVANRADLRDDEQESVTLASDSTEDLMLAWLNELIFLSETRHRLYSRFAVTVDESGRNLHATIAGEPIDVARHVLDHEVKAATRHGLFVEPCDEGWLAEIVLDI
jgi:SHS2 domain-containing protein